MSIQEPATSTSNSAGQIAVESPSLASSRPTASRLASRHDRREFTVKPSIKPLLFCLAISVVLRVWLTMHTQGFIDGDEALVGIQAQNILHGQFPIYFYHQPYMGSLEAYLMAIIFAIAGSSVWTIRAEPILLTLVVVWLTWRLAGELADTAQLPLHAKQWFMNIAALFSALPPLYDTIMEMRMLGGYIESFIIMLLLLLSTLRLTNRRSAGARRREMALRWAGIGFLLGLGFWVNPLTSYAALAIAPWLLWDSIKALRQARATAERSAAWQIIPPILAALPACIIGMAPAIAWGAANQWQNFTYLFQINNSLRPEITSQYPTRLSIADGLVKLYTTCLAPRLVGGGLPGTSASEAPLAFPMLAMGMLCITGVVVLVMLSFARMDNSQGTALERYQPLLLQTRRLVALPLIFTISTTVIFCGTSTAAIGLWNCQYDLAGRYATPIMLVLPFFYATFFTVVILLDGTLHGHQNKSIEGHEEQDQGDHYQQSTPGGGSTDARQNEHYQDGQGDREGRPYPTRFAPSDAPVYGRGDPRGRSVRPAATTSQISSAVIGLMVSFLLLALLFQVGLYSTTDPGSTFQSPYCTFAPANDDDIIAYLQKNHIHYAWAINWLAFPIDFKTHGSITVSDPLAIIRHNPSLNRIPAYTNAVLASDRPSFIVLVKHDDPYPLVLQMFDVQLVKYQYARFPAQQGRDVLVVTPLNKTVNPTDPSVADIYFNIFVCSLDS